MDKISPCLWFAHEAEEAALFYTSLFDDGRILDVTRYGDAGPGAPGSVLTVAFEMGGRTYVALNGGTRFPYTEAFSLQVLCDDQAEVDRLWKALTDGGEEGRCAWLKDRYGVSWQIVPRRLMELLGGPDPAVAQRVTEAMLRMDKIEVAELERAAAG